MIDLLRQINILQFFDIPSFLQNKPLLVRVLKCWSPKMGLFNINGTFLQFTVEEVANMVGMPNRGEHVDLQSNVGGGHVKAQEVRIDQSPRPSHLISPIY